MEGSISRQCLKQNLQIAGRKCGSHKDLWFVVREGSVSDVESALTLLKKNGGNIDSRNMFGLTPLHIATWRNHIPIVKKLLAAGADPNARVSILPFSSFLFIFYLFAHVVLLACS